MATKGTEVLKHERPRYPVPFDEMERWFEELYRRPFQLLSPSIRTELGEFGKLMPTVDMYEEGNEMVVTADMPGLDKKDIDISVTSNTLTISAKREKEQKVEKGNYFSYERSHGSLFRRIDLPVEVNTEKIRAHLEKGILEIRLPKTEEARKKTKTIAIT